MLTADTETQVSLKNILAATDFSSTSETALDYGLEIAQRYNSKIFLAHVIDLGSLALEQPENASLVAEQSRLDAQEKLRKEVVRFKGVPYEFRLESGVVGDVLQSLVARDNIDLIVLGTRGAEGIKKLFLGSTAEAVFRGVRCPVLTVGPHACPHPPHIKRILLPTDLLSDCSVAARYAASLAKEHNANLTLQHVMPLLQPPPPEDALTMKKPVLARLARLLPLHAALPHAADLVVEFGEDPVEHILRLARELPADLVVLSVRRAESWVTHLPDKAFRIVAEASCPVLTISEQMGR
ncbi:MAG: universal stress protein [Candidatus Korobacteraceae bacterium]|jgi:nucleotide-binding universal stress UspA family protein